MSWSNRKTSVCYTFPDGTRREDVLDRHVSGQAAEVEAKARWLEQTPGLRRLPQEDLRRLALGGREWDVPPGQPIRSDDLSVFEAALIVAGEGEVWSDGERRGRLGSGHFLGEMDWMVPGESEATLRSGARMRLLVLSTEALDVGLAAPAIAEELAIGFAERLRSAPARPRLHAAFDGDTAIDRDVMAGTARY
ncbi:MAG: cyclic nucleotide-binding domain-containing protein [Acidimicrobiales bacterium]